MHKYMTDVYALSSISIAYEWHISPATDNTPSGRRFLNILPPRRGIVVRENFNLIIFFCHPVADADLRKEIDRFRRIGF